MILWGVCWMFFDEQYRANPYHDYAKTWTEDIVQPSQTNNYEVDDTGEIDRSHSSLTAGAKPNTETLVAATPLLPRNTECSRHYAAQQSDQPAPHGYKFDVSTAITTALPEAATSFNRYDLPPFSGATSSVSDPDLLPNTSIWSASTWETSFYSPSNIPQIQSSERQSHMSSSTTLHPSPTVTTAPQPNPFVYNYTVPLAPPPRPLSARRTFPNFQPQGTRHQMITLPGSTSPVSPVSLNNDDKFTSVSPRPRTESNASVPSIPITSPTMSDTGTLEQDQFRLPRVNHPKRSGEPPKNAQGKLICTVSEQCSQLLFDRKCEWSKHMDKHDRPYKCSYPQCSKLQGFTYSGGLLRHEREVHKKHGGPRESLMCPFKDCKRSTGSGFTRKENLNEHLRRVHRRTDDDRPIKSDDPDDGYDDTDEPDSVSLGKRKRVSLLPEQAETALLNSGDPLREEIKRLRIDLDQQRRENADKDQKIQYLEATIRHFAGQMK
ncbi:MAG: hypothetical protein M1820_003418 [Bogoriella megaspora]|nr:MAG: hypothetical protein M1820_003418 [Bogoriella megaspora]